ncbi:MAG TPA: tetratricopeptide repeat protein [Pyrinomonadaceae bacterium]|jgi:Tfp pilus assembly protein PilF|nr:tetratricopeptide repeat protein [Pyrinomonadaceae bacterium]
MFSHSRITLTTNRRPFFSIAIVLVALLFSLSVAYAQEIPGVSWVGMVGNEEISGRIFYPPGDHTAARPVVKLRSSSSMELTGVLDSDGRFRFIHLRPDQYTVVIDGGDLYEKVSEMVTIGTAGPVPAQGNPFDYAIPFVFEVQIYLTPKRSNSAASLPGTPNPALAGVPAAARDLFNQALEFAHEGKSLKAIELLQSAVSQAPKFTLAYNELGVQFLKAGKADKAAAALKQGLAIAPEDFTLCLNYGIALLNLKDFNNAETQLRLAIQKNGSSPVAHFYLGLAVMNEKKFDLAEAEFETTIKNGGEKLALVHKYLGGVYWRNTHYKQAADELEKYVTLEPKAPDAKKIRDTIKQLRNRS